MLSHVQHSAAEQSHSCPIDERTCQINTRDRPHHENVTRTSTGLRCWAWWWMSAGETGCARRLERLLQRTHRDTDRVISPVTLHSIHEPEDTERAVSSCIEIESLRRATQGRTSEGIDDKQLHSRRRCNGIDCFKGSCWRSSSTADAGADPQNVCMIWADPYSSNRGLTDPRWYATEDVAAWSNYSEAMKSVWRRSCPCHHWPVQIIVIHWRWSSYFREARITPRTRAWMRQTRVTIGPISNLITMATSGSRPDCNDLPWSILSLGNWDLHIYT